MAICLARLAARRPLLPARAHRGAVRGISERYGRRPELYEDDVFEPIDETPAQSTYRWKPPSVQVHVPPRLPEREASSVDHELRSEPSPETVDQSAAPHSPASSQQPIHAESHLPGRHGQQQSDLHPPQQSIPQQPVHTASHHPERLIWPTPSTKDSTHVNMQLQPTTQQRHCPESETQHHTTSAPRQTSPMQPSSDEELKVSRSVSLNPGPHIEPRSTSAGEPATLQTSSYKEHPAVASQTPEQVRSMLASCAATLEGPGEFPKPIWQFTHAGFPDAVVKQLEKTGFKAPTPIQSIAWPVALSGLDMIGLAQTGSGKTLAYLLPAFVHVAAQPRVEPGQGPIVLVLAPTRELATQIQMEAFYFSELLGLRDAMVCGGVARRGQEQQLRRGVEILIATPGRLIDFLDGGVTNLAKVSYLVVDEADRMLDMGFEPQLRRVVSQIRPNRQTLLWSATWPIQIQQLAREFCKEAPAKLSIGVGHDQARANSNIKQEVHLVSELDKKQRFFDWIKAACPPGGPQPRVLVFVETKRGADALCRELRYEQFEAAAIHGDRSQRERDAALHQFRTGRCHVLVATDVAQRGLDIKDVAFVVNYDMPKTIEGYVHRIGRTGRAGAQGSAVSFFGCDFPSPERMRMAEKLCKVMQDAGQAPSLPLQRLAGHAAE
eukprot:TRINITY_DN43774_c0_g1_i1.p1 TRINITY_DN43774_c0_g1~~TRINITY_DN43774_c0_g1_i1.p1  ORF type:complete len:676 (-),score=115.56 TRINITY_DN43774_c0_g1_i1:48-2039(-)